MGRLGVQRTTGHQLALNQGKQGQGYSLIYLLYRHSVMLRNVQKSIALH